MSIQLKARCALTAFIRSQGGDGKDLSRASLGTLQVHLPQGQKEGHMVAQIGRAHYRIPFKVEDGSIIIAREREWGKE